MRRTPADISNRKIVCNVQKYKYKYKLKGVFSQFRDANKSSTRVHMLGFQGCHRLCVNDVPLSSRNTTR